MREKFYKIAVSKHLNSSSSVLVVGAGPVDIKVFNDLGFKKIKFTNLITNKKFSQIKFGNMEIFSNIWKYFSGNMQYLDTQVLEKKFLSEKQREQRPT
jgi:hypothetical protein